MIINWILLEPFIIYQILVLASPSILTVLMILSSLELTLNCAPFMKGTPVNISKLIKQKERKAKKSLLKRSSKLILTRAKLWED